MVVVEGGSLLLRVEEEVETGVRSREGGGVRWSRASRRRWGEKRKRPTLLIGSKQARAAL